MQPLQRSGFIQFDNLIDSFKNLEVKNKAKAEINYSKVEKKIIEIIQNYNLLGVSELNSVLNRLNEVAARSLEAKPGVLAFLENKYFSKKNKEDISHLCRFITSIKNINEQLINLDEPSHLQHLSDIAKQLSKDQPALANRLLAILPFNPVRQVWEAACNQELINSVKKQMHYLERGPLNNQKERLIALHQLDITITSLLNNPQVDEKGEISTELIKNLVTIQKQLSDQIFRKPTLVYSEKVLQMQINKLNTIHEKAYYTSQLLTSFSLLPKNVENLNTLESAETLQPFVEWANKLIQSEAKFAYQLMRNLGETTKNNLLKTLVKDYQKIDFGSQAIHVHALEIILGLHAEICEVKYGKLEGLEGKLDLSHANPKAVQSLLIREEKNLNHLTLPYTFLTSDEATLLAIREGTLCSFDGIQELHVTCLPNHKSLELKGEQLHTFLSLFPHAHMVSLPPIHLVDSKELVILDKITSRVTPEMEIIEKQFKQVSPYLRLALMRAFGESNNFSEELYRCLFKVAAKEDFLKSDYVFQTVLKSPLLASHHPVTLLDSMFANDWMTFSHQLLSLGLLDQVVLKPQPNKESYESIDLSEQPLLTDEKLQNFLYLADAQGKSNFAKINQLKLRHCPNITSKCIEGLFSKGLNLKELDLSGNAQITDETFINLPTTTVSALSSIKLIGTAVTARGVAALKRRYPDIYIMWDSRNQTGNQLRKEGGALSLTLGEKKIAIHPELLARLSPELSKQWGNGKVPERLEFKTQLSERSIQVLLDYLYEGNVSQLDENSAQELLNFFGKEQLSLKGLQYRSGFYLIYSTTPKNVLARLESYPKLNKYFLHYLATCCYPGTLGFDKMPLQQQNRVQQLLKAYEPPLIPPTGLLQEEKILTSYFPDALQDSLFIKSPDGESFMELVNINLLRLQSNEFCEALRGDSSKIIVSDPNTFALMLKTWKNKEANPFDFKNGTMNLSEGVNFLEETSRWGLLDSGVIRFDSIDWWLEFHLKASATHPDWSRLENWVNSHVKESEKGKIFKAMRLCCDKQP